MCGILEHPPVAHPGAGDDLPAPFGLQPQEEPPSAPSGENGRRSSITLLNVDDCEPTRYAITRILQQAGFEVVEAASGAEALRLAEAQPNLILLDVNLPDINGFEVCQQLKANPRTASIPVLHLSATFTGSENRAYGLEHGANGYLVHPVDPRELVATVKSLLRIREAEETAQALARQWQTTFDAISDGVCLLDREGRIVRRNQAMADLLGRPGADATGRRWQELKPCVLGPAEGCPWMRLRETKRREVVELQVGERWFHITADPVLDEDGVLTGAVIVLADVTERHRTEAELAAAKDALTDQLADMTRLRELSARLSTTLELRPVLEEVLAAVVAIQDTDMGTLSLADRSGNGLHTAASVGFSQAHLDTVQYVPRGVGACGTALAERRAVIVEDVETDPIFTPYLHVARLAGYRAVYSLPLFTRHGEVLGTITAHFRQPHRPSDRERRLVELYARQAADFIDNARLYRQRSEIARTLQQSLLPPQLPEIPGVELAASYRPAFEGTDVGGDFYDLFEAGEGVWSLIIGDVSGKGVVAAAMTALTRHTARAVTPYERTPSGVLARLNEAILQQHQGEGFCTAAYGRLALSPHARGRRPRTLSGQVTGGGERNKIRARLTLALGGHPQPLLLRRDGSVAPIGAPGTLLGQLPDPRLTDRTVELGPEDAVVLYTDGVIEAHVADDLFGQARLISLLGACAGCDAGTITQRIEHAVGQFQGDTPRDDIAILVLRIAPVP